MAWQREHVVALLLGIVLGWVGVHLLLPEAPSFQPKRIYPSRYEIGAASSLAPPIPTAREGFPEAASPKEGAATAAATPPLPRFRTGLTDADLDLDSEGASAGRRAPAGSPGAEEVILCSWVATLKRLVLRAPGRPCSSRGPCGVTWRPAEVQGGSGGASVGRRVPRRSPGR